MPKLNAAWWIAGLVVALLVATLLNGPYASSVVNLVAIAALMAASMRFVMLIGELSFATSAFVALGAYGAGIATTLFDWPFVLALILGPLAVIVVSIAFGLVTLRIKGAYFMLIGFAFTEAVRIALTKTTIVGGVSGMTGVFPPRWLDPWLAPFVVAVVTVFLFLLYAIEKSDFGKVLVAIRDNENIARTVGIDVLFCKVACFAIASVCAGIAGSLQAFVNNVISPGDFSFLLAAFALAYVKVGGESSIVGSIVGAVVMVLLASFALGLGAGEHLFYGAAIVLAVLFMPNGLVGLAQKVLRRLTSRPSSGPSTGAGTNVANSTAQGH
jgi:branched-chain amino acid transport system permease protein